MSTKHKRNFKYLGLTLAPALLIVLVILVPSMGIGQTSLPTLNPQNAVSNAGSLLTSNCMECHDETALITGKKTAWEESVHATGTAMAYAGSRPVCSGCHSGSGFSTRVAAGQDPVHPDPNNPIPGDPNPTHMDCRACHQIHSTYTGADWALETTAPVKLAIEGKTFDGGSGNLCASCHQPRTAPPVAVNGVVTGITSHWGPHHGPQSSMMLGTGGAGAAGNGAPAPHYSAVEDTCVTCHMGANDTHNYEPNIATCKGCHPSATNFNINNVQSETQAKMDELGNLLVAAGVLSSIDPAEGHPIVSQAPENVANALYNWIFIAKEDKSKGVHNSGYTEALLDASIAAMQP